MWCLSIICIELKKIQLLIPHPFRSVNLKANRTPHPLPVWIVLCCCCWWWWSFFSVCFFSLSLFVSFVHIFFFNLIEMFRLFILIHVQTVWLENLKGTWGKYHTFIAWSWRRYKYLFPQEKNHILGYINMKYIYKSLFFLNINAINCLLYWTTGGYIECIGF